MKVGARMPLRLIKGFKYGLFLVLMVVIVQSLSLGYRLITTDTSRVGLDLKGLKAELGNLKAVKSEAAVISRKEKWIEFKGDNLFQTTQNAALEHSSQSKVRTPNFILEATSILGSGGENLALMKVEGRAKSYLVQLGDKIADYQIEEIKAKKVLLQNSQEELIIRLND